MSTDLIKGGEFVELYSPVAEEGGADRYSSADARVRELEERLAALSAERDRSVAEAGRRARDEAIAEARDEHAAAVDALRAAAAELTALIGGEHEVAHDEIVAIATAVASKVLRREIARDDAFVVRLVRRCLHKIVHRTKVGVRVHPDDHAVVRDALEAPDEELGPPHEITVIEDRRVQRGGCVVETPDFVVDGTVRTQVAAAAEALRGEGA